MSEQQQPPQASSSQEQPSSLIVPKTAQSQKENAKNDQTQEKNETVVGPFKTLDEALDYIEKTMMTVIGMKPSKNAEIEKVLYMIALTFHEINKGIEAAGMKWEEKKNKKVW